MELTFRPGVPGDLPQIEDMTRGIWGGEDYLPRVWHDWAQAANSHLRVGTLGDEVVATGRIQELSPGYWWLEGLRVHPAHQGKGYATALHHMLVSLALSQPGVRRIALTTDWDNEKVAHLSRASGMELVARHRYFRGEAEQRNDDYHHKAHRDHKERQDEGELTADEIYDRMAGGEWLEATGGYVMWGWTAYPATREWVARVLETGRVLRRGDALALTGPSSRGTQAWLYWFGGGTEEERVAVVRDARRLVPSWRDADGALRGFTAPLESLYATALAAGMHDPDEDGPFYLNHFVREIP